jgi:LemA protein
MKKLSPLGCLALVALGVVVLGMAGCGTYNRLVSLREGVDQAWAQVENVYQRRFDLIPNYVRAVEGQANFEKGTLTEIAEARAAVGKINLQPGTVPDEATLQQWEAAQSRLGGALGRLLAVAENYPQLRANEGFLGLQAELAGSENRIAVERRNFNTAAQGYNTAIKTMPAALFAGALGFSPRPYFKAVAGSEAPPEVKFDFGQKAGQ